MGRIPAAWIACALLLSACGGGAQEAPPAGLTAGELAWLRAVAAWGTDVSEAVDDARAARERALAGEAGPGDARAGLSRLRDCRRAVRRLPAAPTDRMRGAAELLERICDDYEAFAAAVASAFVRDPADAVFRSEQADAQGSERMLTLLQGLGSLLRDNRELPVEHGGTESRVDPLYSAAGGELARDRVEVRCWAKTEWTDVMRERDAFSDGALNVHETLGFAWPDDRRAHLSPRICAALDRYTLDGEGADGEELATAVVVLAHEVLHVRAPEAGEAEVECVAFQEARGVAITLGATEGEAARIVDRYWRNVYPHADELYRSPECRPGGALDLDPDDPRWP